MSDVEVKPAKEKTAKTTTITLNSEVVEKVTAYLEQANSYLRGITISRSLFVNWLINQSSGSLSEFELANLTKHFQSEKGRALWVYEEILRSEQAGVSKTIEDVLKEKYDDHTPARSKLVRQKRKKKDAVLTAEGPSSAEILRPSNEKNESQNEESSDQALGLPKGEF